LKKFKIQTKTFRIVTTLFIILSLNYSATAQQWTGSTTNSGSITRIGDLTTTEGSLQRVTIGPAWGGLFGGGYVGFNLRRENTGLWSYLSDGASSGGSVIYSDVTGSLNFSIRNGWFLNTTGNLTDGDIGANLAMKINQNGKVIIGTGISSFPNGYRLFVEEGILTEKLKVSIKNTADWSDYVFARNYKLMPIYSLKRYIIANKHLPGVPSASQMVDQGLDVAKSEASLLAKIEELTLYMIQLKEENDKLQTRIALIEKSK
jgi:hypothetical protein